MDILVYIPLFIAMRSLEQHEKWGTVYIIKIKLI